MANTLNTPLQTRTYSDIALSFTPNPITGDLTKVTGVNSVVQSIVSLVSTNHYERPFHPEIGGNIRKLLFELADGVTANLIAEEIKDVLNNFEPRATIQAVNVQTVTQPLEGFQVTIVFTVTGGIATPIEIAVFLERLR
jgi:phage baseplate assembly protein W